MGSHAAGTCGGGEVKPCVECGRPRAGGVAARPPEPAVYCGECFALFSLEEVDKIFGEFNLCSSNSARDVRRQLFGAVLDMLRTAK